MIHARWYTVSTLDCLTHELLAKRTSMQITAPVWFKAGAQNFPEGDLDSVGSSNLVHLVQIISTRDPAAAPWKEMIVAIVIEGTGAFNSSEGSSKHIEAGTKKVVITVPGKNYPAGTSRCLTPEWVTQYTGVQIDEPEWLEPGAQIFSGGDLDYHDDSNLLRAQYFAVTAAGHVVLLGAFGAYRVHDDPLRKDLHLLRPGEAFDPLVRTDNSDTVTELQMQRITNSRWAMASVFRYYVQAIATDEGFVERWTSQIALASICV